ncbi:MAG: hypothetical protein ACR2MK_09795 [Solirubrobacteraceae bacterium]
MIRPRPSIAIIAVSCGLVIGACGSSGSPSSAAGTGATGGSSHYASFLKFSTCMRSHGVPDFPDPSSNGGLRLRVGPGSRLNPQSPAFQSAQQTCRKLLPGGGPPRTVPEAQRRAAIANAQCMRTHGVPDFPDPTFPPGGGIRITAVDPQSPAFQAASKACGNGPPGPPP